MHGKIAIVGMGMGAATEKSGNGIGKMLMTGG